MKEPHHSSTPASLHYDLSKSTETNFYRPPENGRKSQREAERGRLVHTTSPSEDQQYPKTHKLTTNKQVLRLLKCRNVKHTPRKPTSLLPTPANPKPTNRHQQPLNNDNNLRPRSLRPNRLRPNRDKQNLPPNRRSRRLKSRQRAQPPLLPLHSGQHLN